jgi:hypothetical protein
MRTGAPGRKIVRAAAPRSVASRFSPATRCIVMALKKCGSASNVAAYAMTWKRTLSLRRVQPPAASRAARRNGRSAWVHCSGDGWLAVGRPAAPLPGVEPGIPRVIFLSRNVEPFAQMVKRRAGVMVERPEPRGVGEAGAGFRRRRAGVTGDRFIDGRACGLGPDYPAVPSTHF